VGGQRHAPTALPPVKSRYLLYRRLGGPQSWSGCVWKISPLPGFDPRTVQSVASRYIDWAIPDPTSLLLGAVNCSMSSAVLAPLLRCKTVTRHCCYFSGNPRPVFDLRIKRLSLLIASREEWWRGVRWGGECWTGELQIPEPKFSTLLHSGVLNLSLLFWVVFPFSLLSPNSFASWN
jgi:hypothetical protein